MDITRYAVAVRTLGLLALVATTVLPAPRHGDADHGRASPPAATSGVMPIVVAQGRCFNGKCY